MVRNPLIPPKKTKFARGDNVILKGEVMKSRIDEMGKEQVSVDIDGYGMAVVTLPAEFVEKAPE
jgi:hypothetical protein